MYHPGKHHCACKCGCPVCDRNLSSFELVNMAQKLTTPTAILAGNASSEEGSLAGKGKYAPVGGELPESGQQWSWATLLLLGGEAVAIGGYLGFLVYAIVAGNADEVRSACPKVWEFMVVRAISGGALGLGVYGVYWYLHTYFDGGLRTLWRLLAALWTFLMVFFGAYAVSGAIFVSAYFPGSGKCADALTSHSFTHTPLLGIMSWVTISIDALAFVCAALVLGFLLYNYQTQPVTTRGSSKNNIVNK